MWRGEVWRGRAGQAFQLGEPGVVDGATANSSPQTAAGHHRVTRPSRRSSSLGAACGFWIRAWGQREPALQGIGRLNRFAQWLGWLKGGLDIPATHAECRSLRRERPLRSLTRRDRSRTGRVGNARVASHRSFLCKDGGLSDGSRPFPTTSGPRWLMSQWPNSTSAQHRSCSHSVQDTGRARRNKRGEFESYTEP